MGRDSTDGIEFFVAPHPSLGTRIHPFSPHLHTTTDDPLTATFRLNWRDERRSVDIDVESV